MKRKHFIKTALLAIPTLSFASLLNFDRNSLNFGKSNKKGLIVRSGESRFGGELSTPKDAFLHCKVSSTDTQESLFIQTSTPKIFERIGGPPPHIHKNEDETIYVVSGEFIVHLEGEDFTVKTGDTVFIPRGTLHTIINPIENNPGTVVVICSPAPKKVENFFGYISANGTIPTDIIPEGW